MVVGESWGAWLELADAPDLSIFRGTLSRVEHAGTKIFELPVTPPSDLSELERANTADHPFTPVTSLDLLDAEATPDLWHKGFRVFGAVVKAASIIAGANDGARVFRTGGAAANEARLGTNRALGYNITKRWYRCKAPLA